MPEIFHILDNFMNYLNALVRFVTSKYKSESDLV